MIYQADLAGISGPKQCNLQPASRLTGVSRIEAVFRAHFGDERKILAASDQTHNG